MTALDKTYCVSQNCQNECNRKMTTEEKEQLKELAFKGIKITSFIKMGYFCGEPEISSSNEST